MLHAPYTLPILIHDRSIWLEFARNAMACRFEILLHPGHPEIGPEVANEALDVISYMESILSVYLSTSELSRVNARAHEGPVDVSYATASLIQLGLDVYSETGGCFDMTAHRLSQAWGFFRRQGKMPTTSEIESALENVGSNKIDLDLANRTVRFNTPIEINPGGIGKGFALDCAAETLRNKGVHHFAFHGGKSSVLCSGDQLLNEPDCGWKIAVRHPEQSERILGSLVLRNRALGTSGPANQFFYFQGKRYGHIIDPRSGWPAEGMLSVTVIHPEAGRADALATGLYVMGLDAAIEYCASHTQIGMLAILAGKRAGETEIVTCNLDERTWLPGTP